MDAFFDCPKSGTSCRPSPGCAGATPSRTDSVCSRKSGSTCCAPRDCTRWDLGIHPKNRLSINDEAPWSRKQQGKTDPAREEYSCDKVLNNQAAIFLRKPGVSCNVRQEFIEAPASRQRRYSISEGLSTLVVPTPILDGWCTAAAQPPMICTLRRRVRGPSSSKNSSDCQVPSFSSPATTGMASLAPNNIAIK